MKINKIKYLNTISDLLIYTCIVSDTQMSKIFYFKFDEDKIYEWNFYNNSINEISPELIDIFPDKIFYDENSSILIIADGIYIFDIESKNISKVLGFNHEEYYYINYFSEINKIILVKSIKNNGSLKHKVELFDIKSLKISTFIEEISFEVKEVYYSDEKIFFNLNSNTFNSTIEIYSVKNKDLIYDFNYGDNIFEMIYFKDQEKILFLYNSAEPKPSFIKIFNLKNNMYEFIQNCEEESIFNISNYDDEYFVYLSNNKITFCKKDLSSKKSYTIDKIANKSIFPSGDKFKRFITYDKYSNDKKIDIWELIE